MATGPFIHGAERFASGPRIDPLLVDGTKQSDNKKGPILNACSLCPIVVVDYTEVCYVTPVYIARARRMCRT